MKILVAPSAFKGSVSHTAAAHAIVTGLRRSGLRADFVIMPLADGGDGTLDAFLALGGQRTDIETADPLHRPVTAAFGVLPDQETAVIEMALASGLALMQRQEIGPESALKSSTYGTGVLIRAALDAGVRRIIVGMGGSATTDGGAGCLRALGLRLLDARGQLLPDGGGALAGLAVIETQGLDPRLRETEIIIASDVENTALGAQGAAAVFAPQKGAGPDEVARLEQGLSRWLELTAAATGRDVRALSGGGAAGAFAAGLMAYTQARIQSGVTLLLDYHNFDAHLRDAALVITGEGQIDSQTLAGKGPIGMARRAQAHGVPCVALVGGIHGDEALLHAAGIAAVLPIVTRPMALDDALLQAETLIEQAALRLGYLLELGGALHMRHPSDTPQI
jgi:glycerate kinase